MEIILLQDVEKIGLRGDVVNVADGYARNFLLPRRFAERATAPKVAELRKREEQRARQEARTAEQAQEIAGKLAKAVLRFDVPTGPTGRLFGSVTATNIADELWQTQRVRVDRRKIGLAESIKRIGRYEVPVEIFDDVVVEVETLVVPEGGELPSEEELAAMEAAERPEPAPEAEAEEELVFEDELEAEEKGEAEVPEPAPEAEAAAAEPAPEAEAAAAEPEAEAEAAEAEPEPTPESEAEAEPEPMPESEQ